MNLITQHRSFQHSTVSFYCVSCTRVMTHNHTERKGFRLSLISLRISTSCHLLGVFPRLCCLRFAYWGGSWRNSVSFHYALSQLYIVEMTIKPLDLTWVDDLEILNMLALYIHRPGSCLDGRGRVRSKTEREPNLTERIRGEKICTLDMFLISKYLT